MSWNESIKQPGYAPQECPALILGEIEAEHQAWINLILSLTAEQIRIPVEGSWSVRDTLVHTTAWIENAVRIAHLQADPKAPDPGPTRGPAGYLHIHVDRFNAEVFKAHHWWLREEVLVWSEQVNHDLHAALEKLPLERVIGGAGRYGARMWFWRPAFIHSLGHRRRVDQLIRAKLTRIPE